MSDRIPEWITLENGIDVNERILRFVEYIASIVLIGLFAIGVFDLIIEIYELMRSGSILNPESVINLIDTVLLLFIIVELHKTVVAYATEKGLNKVVTIVVYTAIIAVARKFIIFRTGEYQSVEQALFAAGSYGLIAVTLAILMYALNRFTTAENYGE